MNLIDRLKNRLLADERIKAAKRKRRYRQLKRMGARHSVAKAIARA